MKFDKFIEQYVNGTLSKRILYADESDLLTKWVMENVDRDEYLVYPLKSLKNLVYGDSDDEYICHFMIPTDVFTKYDTNTISGAITTYVLGYAKYVVNNFLITSGCAPAIDKNTIINKGTLLKDAVKQIHKIIIGLDNMDLHDREVARITINEAIDYACDCVPYVSLKSVTSAAVAINAELYEEYIEKEKKNGI